MGAHGGGHIHDTYKVECRDGHAPASYILQRVNTSVFPDPVSLMRNVSRVSGHIRSRLTDAGVADVDRRCLTVIPTRAGGTLCQDEESRYWRMFRFIEGSATYPNVSSSRQAHGAGRAFGEFQHHLRDFDPSGLSITLPGFHDTRERLRRFEEGAARADPERLRCARREMELVGSRRALAQEVAGRLEAGTIPTRVTHNDTKLDNVLFDRASAEPLCVIDLDTVMPGSSLYDFGDLVRTCATYCREDEPDLSKAEPNLVLFRALVSGYLASVGEDLLDAEIERLAFSSVLITFELGLRFLTDYLENDVYFKTAHPEHNLQRARTQLHLAAAMESKLPQMEDIVRTVLG